MELNQEWIYRDYIKLPKKYWSNQNLCWYLHDVILSIFMEVIDEDLTTTKIGFQNEVEVSYLENCEDIYEWLNEQNRHEELALILSKDLSMRLLADFLNYIYEVLSNLERGKITIACDLLRKPFKDNLFYLEWLLFDGNELSFLVFNGEIDKYAMGKSGLSRENIKEIVLDSVSKNRFISEFKSKELEQSIYDIRYNYDSSNSLELIWNKATHLVTTNRKIKTKDFNFIYHNSQDYDDYWNYLYGKIPLLLLYSVGIVENIFDKYFRKIDNTSKMYNFLLIMGKFLGKDEETQKSADVLIRSINGKLTLICENCSKIVKINKSENYIFYNYWNLTCPECKEEINTCRYFFLEKYK